MTMTFVSLVLIQFFKAYNFRSDRRSVLDRPFANKWLNLAIVWELACSLLIVYVPFLQSRSAPSPAAGGLGHRGRLRADDRAGARSGQVGRAAILAGLARLRSNALPPAQRWPSGDAARLTF